MAEVMETSSRSMERAHNQDPEKAAPFKNFEAEI
jgi:hypothetical protein